MQLQLVSLCEPVVSGAYMPAAKLSASGTLNSMKSEEVNGSDSLDTFIRQAIGKEPLLPSPRTSDSPVQWIQLLNALDQPDLPGWPLLTPAKVKMQKCEKCSQEFCSPINYRRHIRVHRRSLNVNKEYNKNRDLLAAFWDKLSFEQAKEVASFNDVMLKDIPGLSIVRALASSLRRPGVWTLPQPYVKAGSKLLDIIQAKPSTSSISSQELFSILDDASERTFLCAGTADSVQKYVFDGETIKNSLELKNLVANTSFLFELLLVKAWVADKDAEALRCQKLLVEEEEAAQKRRALLLERKKQKKLRHKEQKVKERLNGNNGNLNVYVDVVDRPTSTEPSGPSSPSDSNSNSPDVLTNLGSVPPQNNESDEDIEVQIGHMKPGDSQTTDSVVGIGHPHLATNRWQASKPQRSGRYAFHSNLNHQTFKPEPKHKLGPPVKERSMQNSSKVWTKKLKNNSDRENVKPPPSQEVPNEIEQNNSEVIIGSIPITLKSSAAQQQESRQNEAQDAYTTENALLKKKNASEKLGTNRVTSKLWRPVSRGEMKNTNISPADRNNEDSNGGDNQKQFREPSNEDSQQAPVPFSSDAAREFLARRWKEAISGDHVRLVLSPGPQPPECSDVHHESSTVLIVSDPPKGSITKKPEKSVKFKYIPKQKAAA
ncbi:hypothetical protein ACS0TY_004577 [Phlomoides rotata]